MKLLADENFPLSSVKFLEKSNLDVKYIGRDYAGISDIEVIDLAIQESRTILTFDKDYGTLIFKFNFRPPQGVIYLRLNEFTPTEPGKIIVNLLDLPDINLHKKMTVITESGFRQRKY